MPFSHHLLRLVDCLLDYLLYANLPVNGCVYVCVYVCVCVWLVGMYTQTPTESQQGSYDIQMEQLSH